MAATTPVSEKDVLTGPYLEQVALNSQTANHLLRAVSVTNLDREFWDRYWRISGVYKVQNERLQKSFTEFKEELKSENAKPEQCREVLVFSNETKKSVDEISREGSRAGARKSHVLGHAGSGVHLVRHYDILTRYLAIKQGSAPCYIVIHRAVLGKTKPIVPRIHKDENFVKPYIGFDCHVSARRVQSRMPIHDAYKSSHIFFYEHKTDASFTSEYPRQILPHAVIELDKKHPIHFETPFLAVGSKVSLWEVKGETRRGFRFVLAKQTAKQDERPLTRKRKIDQLKTQLQDQLLEMRTRWPDSCSESKTPRLSPSGSVDDKTESEVLTECEQSDVVEKKPIPGDKRQDKQIVSGKIIDRTEGIRTPEYSIESKRSFLARNCTDVPLSYKPYVSLRRLSANTLGISSGDSTQNHYEPEKTTLVNKGVPSEPCNADGRTIKEESVESRRSNGNVTSEKKPDIGTCLMAGGKSVADIIPKTHEDIDTSIILIRGCLNENKGPEDPGNSSKDYTQDNTRRMNSTDGKSDSGKMNIDEAYKKRHASVGTDAVVSATERNSQSVIAVNAGGVKKTNDCLDKDSDIQDEYRPPVLTAAYEKEITEISYGCGHADVHTTDKDTTCDVHKNSGSIGKETAVCLNPDPQEINIAGNCPKTFLDTREVIANFKAVSKQNLNQLFMHAIHVPNTKQPTLENKRIPNATNEQRPKLDADQNSSTNKSPVVKDTSTLRKAETNDKSLCNLETYVSDEVEIRKRESKGLTIEGQDAHDKPLHCKTTDVDKDTKETNSSGMSCKELSKRESSKRTLENQPSQEDNSPRAKLERNIAPTSVKPEARVLESKPLPKARTESAVACNQDKNIGQNSSTKISIAANETSILRTAGTNEEVREKQVKELSHEVEVRKNKSDSSTNEGQERQVKVENNKPTNIFSVTKETDSSDVTCSKSPTSECSSDLFDSKQPSQIDSTCVHRNQSSVSSSVKQDVSASDPKPMQKTIAESTSTRNQKDKIGNVSREKSLTDPELNATQEDKEQLHGSQTEHITDDDIVFVASAREDELPSAASHDFKHLRKHSESSNGEYDSNYRMHRPDMETSFFKPFLQPIYHRTQTNVTTHNQFLNKTSNENEIGPDTSYEGQIQTPEKSAVTACTYNIVERTGTKQIQRHTRKIPEKIPTIIGVSRSSKTVRTSSTIRPSENATSTPVDNQNTSFFKPFLHTGGTKTGFQNAQPRPKTANSQQTTVSSEYSDTIGQTLILTHGNNQIQAKSYTMTGLSQSISPPAGDIAPTGMNSFPLDLSAKATGGPVAISIPKTNVKVHSEVISEKQSLLNRQRAEATRDMLSSKKEMHVPVTVAMKQNIKDTDNVSSRTPSSATQIPTSATPVSRSTLMKQTNVQDPQSGQLMISQPPLSAARTHTKCYEDSGNQLHTPSNKQNLPKQSTPTSETGIDKSTSDSSCDEGKRCIPSEPTAISTAHAEDKCSKEEGRNIEENPLNILKTRMSVDENTAKRIQQFLFEKILLQTKRQSENGARAENGQKEAKQENVSTDLCTRTECVGQKSNTLPIPTDTLTHASQSTVKYSHSKSETVKQANHLAVKPITSETGAASDEKQVSHLNGKPSPPKLEIDARTKTTLTVSRCSSKTETVTQSSYSTVKRSPSKTETMPQTSHSPFKLNPPKTETMKHASHSNLKPSMSNTENDKPVSNLPNLTDLSCKETRTQGSFKPILSKSEYSKQTSSLTLNRSPSKTENVTNAGTLTIQPKITRTETAKQTSVPIVYRSPSKSESVTKSSTSIVNRTQSKLETVVQTSQSTVNSIPLKSNPTFHASYSTVHTRSLGTYIEKQASAKQARNASVHRNPSKPEFVTRTSPSTVNRFQSKQETVAQINHSTINSSPSRTQTATNSNCLIVNRSPITPVTLTQRNCMTVKDSQSNSEASHSTAQPLSLDTASVKQSKNMTVHRSPSKVERIAQSSHSILKQSTSTIETTVKADHLPLKPTPSNIENMTQTSQNHVKQGELSTDSSPNIDHSNEKRNLQSTSSSSQTNRLSVNQNSSKPETITKNVKPNSLDTETVKQTSNLVLTQAPGKTETLPQFVHSAVGRNLSNLKPVSQTSNLTLHPSPASLETPKQASHTTVTPVRLGITIQTTAENERVKPSNLDSERKKPSSVQYGTSVDNSAKAKAPPHSTVQQHTTTIIQPLRIKTEITDHGYDEYSSQITGVLCNNDDQRPGQNDKETMEGSRSESHHTTQSETLKQAEDMTKGECKRAILQTLNELSDVLKRINESKKAKELAAFKTSIENKKGMDINRKKEEEIKMNSVITATDKTTDTITKATINSVSNDRSPLHENQNNDVSRARTIGKDTQGQTKASLAPTNPPGPYDNSMQRCNNMTTKESHNSASDNMLVYPIITVKVERSEEDHTCNTEPLPFQRDTMERSNCSSGFEHPHIHPNEGRCQSPQRHEFNPVDQEFSERRVCVSEQPNITGSENRDLLPNQRKTYRHTSLREISHTSEDNTYKRKSGNIPANTQRVESTERPHSDNSGLEDNMIVRDAVTASRDNTRYNEYRECLQTDCLDQSSIEERWARINYSSSFLGPLDRSSETELVPVSAQESTGIVERIQEVCDGDDISKTRQKQSDTDGEVIFSFQEVRRMKSIQFRKYKMGVSQKKYIDYADVRHEYENKGNRRNERNTFERHKGDRRSDSPSTQTRSYTSKMNRSIFSTRERKGQRSRVRKPDSADFRREHTSPPKRSNYTREIHNERTKTRKLPNSNNKFKKHGTGYFKWRSKYNPRQPGKDTEGEYIITKRGKRQSIAEFNRWTKFKERETIRKNIELALREYKKTFEKEDKTNADRKVASYLQSLSGPSGRKKDEKSEQTARSSLTRKNDKTIQVAQCVSGTKDPESVSQSTSGGRDHTVKNDRDTEVSVNKLVRSQPLINPVQPDLGNLLSANVIEGLIRQHVASNFEHLTEKLKDEMSRQLLGNASSQSSLQPAAETKASSDSQGWKGSESTRNKRGTCSRSNSREKAMRKYDTYRNRSDSPETVDHGAYALTSRRNSYDNQDDTRGEPNRRRSSPRERERNFETSFAIDRRNSYSQRSQSRDRETEYISSYMDDRSDRRNSYRNRGESKDRERDYLSSYRGDRRNSYRHRSPNRDFEREYISESHRNDNNDSYQYKTEPRDADMEYVSSYRDDTRQSYRHGSKSGDEESQYAASYRNETRHAYQRRSKSRDAEPAYESSHRRHSRSPTSFEKDDYDYRFSGGSSRHNRDRDYGNDEYYSNSQKSAQYDEYQERTSSQKGRYDEIQGSYKGRNERSPRRTLSREDRYESGSVERHRSGSRGDDFDIYYRDSSRYRGYANKTAYRKSPDALRGETVHSTRRERTRSRSNGRDSSNETRGSVPSLKNVSSLEDEMLQKTRSDSSESNNRRKWHFYPTQSEYATGSYSETSTHKRHFRHIHSEDDYRRHADRAKRHDYLSHQTKDKRPRLDYSPDTDFKLSKSPIRSDHHICVSSNERSKSPSEHKPSMNELDTAVSHKISHSEPSEISARDGTTRKNDSQQYEYNTRNLSTPDQYISMDRVDDSDPVSEEFDTYQFCRDTYPGIPRPDPKKHRYYPPKASATVTQASPEHRSEGST